MGLNVKSVMDGKSLNIILASFKTKPCSLGNNCKKKICAYFHSKIDCRKMFFNTIFIFFF